MKRTFLAKIQRNGTYYLIGALLLLLGVPLYQFLILNPQGFGDAISPTNTGQFAPYLTWINGHTAQFLGYRLLLIVAFVLLWSLPFTLFRIIVAQEILGNDDPLQDDKGKIAEGDTVVAPLADAMANDVPTNTEKGKAETDVPLSEPATMPTDAWRGKGFAVIAAWSGLFGIILFVLGTLLSMIYLLAISASINTSGPHLIVPDSFPALAGILAVLTNTVGGALLALATLFFGAVIARRGRNLWPGIWVLFGYMALALAAPLSGSAVAVASAPTQGQSPLTTAAILLFALWVLWFGVMLVRLKPE